MLSPDQFAAIRGAAVAREFLYTLSRMLEHDEIESLKALLTVQTGRPVTVEFGGNQEQGFVMKITVVG